MQIEVLCATMHQKDLGLYDRMNIQTDAVFANQADGFNYQEGVIRGRQVKMVTTPYRGVGNNRNLALLHSSGDVLMFSDDDLVYFDGYEEGVLEAFRELPDADMLVFQCSTDSGRGTPLISKIAKVRLWNFMRYGTSSFVIKKQSLLKHNLNFTQLFGGGSRYCAGEDNLFLREALGQKLKIYSHPFKIAHINYDVSTWFKGFDRKYFFDNGAWLETAFPLLKHLLVWYFVIKFAKKTDLSRWEILKLQYAGMRGFKQGISFDEWEKDVAG